MFRISKKKLIKICKVCKTKIRGYKFCKKCRKEAYRKRALKKGIKYNKEHPGYQKYRKCRKCGKPCYGTLCKDCFKKKGTRVSQRSFNLTTER